MTVGHGLIRRSIKLRVVAPVTQPPSRYLIKHLSASNVPPPTYDWKCRMKATAELVPMGTITVQLGERVDVGQGPKGRRLVVDVLSVDVDCDRVKASLAVNDAADWLTLNHDKSVGCVDVRFTLKTDDGAYIYVEYAGRADMAAGLITTAPTFQTSHEKYSWMNGLQAVAAGVVDGSGVLTYSLYEVAVSAA